MAQNTKSKTTKTVKAGELVFGVHAVLELLTVKRRKVISIYTTKPVIKAWSKIEKLLPKYPINIQYVSRDILSKIAGSSDHQGILAWAYPFAYRKKFFDPAKQPFLVMLDGIQDTRNVGAILRSAYCTGADGVIMLKKHGASLTAAALKASAGLAERLEIYMAPSPIAAIQELKKAGYMPYLATFDGKDATKVEFKRPMCLVIGSEAKGVSREIMRSGEKVTLPQRTEDISYNASVAAGILMFLAANK